MPEKVSIKTIMLFSLWILLMFAAVGVLLIIGMMFGWKIFPSDSDTMFSKSDLQSEWSTAVATKINLSEQSIEGGGAAFADNTLAISAPGSYVLTGKLDGKVVINAGDGKVRLKLNGVDIHNETGAALYVEQAKTVYMTLAAESENVLSCGKEFAEDITKAGIDGALYSHDDVTVNGEGTLEVKSENYHGIVCNDDLIITGGQIKVEAVQDAIHAHDSVRICNADLALSAGDDGITVSNDRGDEFFYIESGSITVDKCYEGIEATKITVAGGNIDLHPSDDGLNAEREINISGGQVCILNPDGRDADGLDSNGDINITGGELFVSLVGQGSNNSIDYGYEDGGRCIINGGKIVACGAAEMMAGFDNSSKQAFVMQSVEGTAGAEIRLTASDGTEIVRQTVPYAFTHISISTPEMQWGDSYTLHIGDKEMSVTADNTKSTEATMPGGQKPQGTPPEKPSGEQPQGNPPEMPSGEQPQGNPPEMPSGEQPQGNPPEKPNGEQPQGNPPNPPAKPDNQQTK